MAIATMSSIRVNALSLFPQKEKNLEYKVILRYIKGLERLLAGVQLPACVERTPLHNDFISMAKETKNASNCVSGIQASSPSIIDFKVAESCRDFFQILPVGLQGIFN